MKEGLLLLRTRRPKIPGLGTEGAVAAIPTSIPAPTPQFLSAGLSEERLGLGSALRKAR